MIFALAAATLGITWMLSMAPSIAALPLGVSVPPAHRDDPTVTAAVTAYRRWVWLFGVIATLICLAGPLFAAFSSLVVTFGALGVYAVQRRRIIAAKKEGGWYNGIETAISARVSPSRNFDGIVQPSFPWIGLGGALLAIALSVLVIASNWDTIPQTFATHFDTSMQPDAWSEKSFFSVFGPTFVNTGLLFFMGLAAWLGTKVKVNPRADRSIKGQVRTAALMSATTNSLAVLCLLTVTSLACLQLAILFPQYNGVIPVAIMALLFASVAGAIGMVAAILCAQTRIEEQLRGVHFPDEGTPSPDNDEHYKWGMFYYNPEDPAVLVDKRFGAGIDFNYATWQAKAFLGGIAAFIIACIALPIALG
ncbi:DUF1648 domain-containing protein [Corynebacterium sp.]|uniref:DUF1648 domain-containing protein n=1 Tax=Corynebacterium sp. TaxID=1720 RepID=UPI0026DD1013|nr:DUF1648 domain-containing protein [Corynebacterium sp.]MDO5033113.1 DUF1648 domain-containing protein [Corynebacterium sp.]